MFMTNFLQKVQFELYEVMMGGAHPTTQFSALCDGPKRMNMQITEAIKGSQTVSTVSTKNVKNAKMHKTQKENKMRKNI